MPVIERTLFDGDHLARHNDPATSVMAAASLDLDLGPKHQAVIDWLAWHGPATDLEMADALTSTGAFTRVEAARRAVRTVREEHGLMSLALNPDGSIMRHRNVTGRLADCWVYNPLGSPSAPPRTAKAEARRNVEAFITAWKSNPMLWDRSIKVGGVPLMMDDLLTVLR